MQHLLKLSNNLQYGLEIMDAQECLASSIAKSLFNGNVDNNSMLLPHLSYAVFIISYLDMALEEHVGYCTTSFLYAITVLSLASINTICSEKLIDIRTNLNNLVNNLILVCSSFLRWFFALFIRNITATSYFITQ